MMSMYQALKLAFSPTKVMFPILGAIVASTVVWIGFIEPISATIAASYTLGILLWVLSLRLFLGLMIALLWRRSDSLPKISMFVVGMILIFVGAVLILPIFSIYAERGV